MIAGARVAGVPSGQTSVAVIFAVPLLLSYTFHERPIRFGLAIGGLLLASSLYPGVLGSVDYRERSFFGVHRVTRDPTGTFRRLVHGNTVHGQQFLDPERRREPLTYYHRTGPAGRLFDTLQEDHDPRLRRVAFVGLGAGALASYGEPGQHWTFLEIDPAVVHIARDTGQFTYLADSAAEVDVVLGDGRLALAHSREKFGLIVVDAFTSDSVPMHLLTREALRIYRARLAPDGLLLFHVSNRYLNLEPVLAALAADADPPMQCLSWSDRVVNETEKQNGKLPSDWVLLAPEGKAGKPRRGLWGRARPRPSVPVWRDDYSNLLHVFRWSGGDE
jgi:SAM-dependent methyltransferase